MILTCIIVENGSPVSPKKKGGRFRSSSTASIRQLARQSLGFTSPTSSSISTSPRNEGEHQHHLLSPNTTHEKSKPPVPPPTTSDVTVNAQIRRPRSSSFRGLIKHARKHSQDHNRDHHHHPPPVSRNLSWWINKPYRHALQQADIAVNDIDADDHEQQALANEQLHKTFPMLGDSENVLAGEKKVHVLIMHPSVQTCILFLSSIQFCILAHVTLLWTLVF